MPMGNVKQVGLSNAWARINVKWQSLSHKIIICSFKECSVQNTLTAVHRMVIHGINSDKELLCGN